MQNILNVFVFLFCFVFFLRDGGGGVQGGRVGLYFFRENKISHTYTHN